mmetsp:Transcript_31159/g.69281  ORF Transcript_31159/g.69281 Transcript_31159/m.69281 type:complete len:247 (-) Transcript_31159:249-989(-)
MARGHALVTENAPEFKDAFKAAHHHTLEVQLCRNTQRKVARQGIVVGDEGAGVRAARHALQHWRLHLKEFLLFQVAPDGGDDAGAGTEGAPRLLCDNHVHVPLPVPLLHVSQPVPLVWQRQQRLGEDLQAAHHHGQLALLCALDAAGGPHDVAHIHQALDQVKAPRLQPLQALTVHVQLHLPLVVPQAQEGELAHHPLGHDTPRNRNLGILHLSSRSQTLVQRLQLRGVVCAVKAVGVRLRTLLPQ